MILLAYSVALIDPANDPALVQGLLREDGFFENLTALCFAGTALIMAIASWRERNLALSLLALLFFFAAGEEISWGQRIFGFGSPDFFTEHNRQREFNIHNLEWLNRQPGAQGIELLSIDRLFAWFWLTHCVAIPICAWRSVRISAFVRRVRLPIVSLWIGLFFPINHLIAKSFEHILSAERYLSVRGYIEIKEYVAAFLFLMIALDFSRRPARTERSFHP